MKLIKTIDKLNVSRRRYLLADALGGRKRQRATLRMARIRATQIDKYRAAVEIYRTGGCSLKEIERASVERLPRSADYTAADRAEPSWPQPARDPLLANAVFCNKGEYWTVGFQDREAFIKDRKGLRYVADLLRCPGVEIHALDLVTGGPRSAEPILVDEADLPPAAIKWRPSRDDRHSAGNAGPMLDRRAMSEYRRRLAELRMELNAAEANGDEERASRAEEETKALERELKRALGIGGRQRLAADPAERARVNVTRTIRLAIGRLEEISPDFGRHLDESIKTGSFCCYRPDRTKPISWRL